MRTAKLPAIASFIMLCMVAAPVHAEKVWKYDDGPEDLGTLQGTKMHAQYAHPGFVNQEAFGAIFKPEAGDYPIQITGVDLLMAAAENEVDPTSKKVNAHIEIWNADNTGPKPSSAKPLWSVHTSDLAAGTKIGVPIQGNTVMKFNFSSNKKGDKPPPITKGNIWVMVRLTSNTSDYSTSYWAQLGCFKGSLLGIEACGCQDLAALTDSITTPNTQVLHIVWPLGKCSGDKKWNFVESLTNQEGFTMTGDFRLRMRTAGGGGSSSGGSSSGGSSSGGDDDAGSTSPPDVSTVLDKPIVNLVTPDNGDEGKSTEVTIIGANFQPGAMVSVGSKACEVVETNATQIKAKVNPTLAPGKYPLIVENPDGQVGFKDGAFTVVKKEEPKPDAGVDSGGGTFTPRGNIAIDGVTPNIVPCTEDTLVTIFGAGFGQGLEFEVDGRKLLAVNVITDIKATALVPKGLSAGKHSVIGKMSGKSVAKVNALEVTCESGGCSVQATAGNSTTSTTLALILLGVLMLGLRRRFETL
jgi:hypothetical protein